MANDKLIYQKIVDIMAEIGAIGKQHENVAQKFRFRGIDDVYNRLHPLLVKHGVFSSSEIIETTRESHVTATGKTLLYAIIRMKYSFCTTDGSCVSVETVGEGMDSGDKATNKAMSAAHKYAMFQLFSIPTELHDPDRSSFDVNARITPKILRETWGDKIPKPKRTFGSWREYIQGVIGKRIENPDDEKEWETADIQRVFTALNTLASGDTVAGTELDAMLDALADAAEAEIAPPTEAEAASGEDEAGYRAALASGEAKELF